jgi:uncharacterized protein YbjT (DUF2867 family)
VSAKKIIAVVGATGAQGGGVVDAVLADPEGGFAVRALTRDPSSDKARALAARGVEVVRGDADEEASLAEAFQGVYGAFLMTNFWEHMDAARETEQAKALARAVHGAGVRHVVWSTMEDTRERIAPDDARFPTLNGYKVPHLDGKGEADAYFRQLGVPTTFMRTSMYWEGLISPWFTRRDDNGTLLLTAPLGDVKLPVIAAESIGRSAYGLRQQPRYIGRTVGIADDHLSGAETAAALSRALGEEVRYEPDSFEALRASGSPGSDDTASMLRYNIVFYESYAGVRDLDVVSSSNPRRLTLDQWLDSRKDVLKAL